MGAALISSVVLWAVKIWSFFSLFLALMVMGRMARIGSIQISFGYELRMEVEPMLWFGYRKLLISAECPNVNSFGPSISLAKETTPCSGATPTYASSSFKPTCCRGGSSSISMWESVSPQVV
jgi:hypothetical protein